MIAGLQAGDGGAAEPSSVDETAVAAPVAESDWQFELYYFGTGRWQIDNGTRTGPEDGNNWDPTGEDFVEWNNTFGGAINYGRYQLALQFDTATYFHRPRAADNATNRVRQELQSRYEDVFRLEFISMSYSGRDVDVTLGDFYVTLGRGMLLAIRKQADLGIDNKLRGAEARMRFGDFTVYGFGGLLNIRNYEASQAFFYPESLPEANCSGVADALVVCPDGIDVIGGGRIEYRWGKYLRTGLHAALIDAPDALNEGPEGAVRGDSNVRGIGFNIELPRPTRWLNAYLEGVLLERLLPNQGANVTETGRGLYLNTNLFFGPTTVLVEAKAYDNLFNVTPRAFSTPPMPITASRQVINRILEPPTAERPFTRILANNTALGGHVRVDHRVAPRLVPFVAGGYFRDRSFDIPTNIIFGYGGFRYQWRHGEATLDAGYRAQLNDPDTAASARAVAAAQAAVDAAPDDQVLIDQLERAETLLRRDELQDGQAFRNDAHVRFDVSFEVGGPFSLEVFGDTFFVISDAGLLDCTAPTAVDAPVCQGIDVESSPLVRAPPEEWVEGRLALSLRSTGGWSVTGAYEFYTRQPGVIAQHYPSLAGQWTFTEGGVVRVLVGGERAGLKCSGGVCRFFPGFEGARLEFVLRM